MNYALYHVNMSSKCMHANAMYVVAYKPNVSILCTGERLIGDSEFPLTFVLFYNEKEQEDLRLVLKRQVVLSTHEKRRTLAPPPTPQKQKNRKIIAPKDAGTQSVIRL